MWKLSAAAFIWFAAGCAGLLGQTVDAPAPLVQYVRDARNAGLDDIQIRKEAEQAGWPPNIVQTALGQPSAKPAAASPKSSDQFAAPAAGSGTATASKAPAAWEVPSKTPPAWDPPPKAPAAPETIPKTSPQPAATESAKQPGAGSSSPDYEIGDGDVLQISVWKEPDASVSSTVVRPDGKISMPLLKEVAVNGLTVSQAQTLITQQLSKFITTPDVTIVVAAINSKKIYVTGAVKKEGPIPYTYRMRILQALSEAGGLTDYAKRKKIYVLHDENGRQFTFPFDYDAALRGQKMELNIYLTPGDTIVVPH